MPKLPCPFERVILSTAFSCAAGLRRYVGEKEAISCTEPASQQRCCDLVRHLRDNAGFVLPRLRDSHVLTHAQELRLKAGGLHGVHTLLGEPPDHDIQQMLRQLATCYPDLALLPTAPLLRAIQARHVRAREPSGS